MAGTGNVYTYNWVQYFNHDFVANAQRTQNLVAENIDMLGASVQSSPISLSTNNYGNLLTNKYALSFKTLLKKGWFIYYDPNNLAVGTVS